MIKNTDRILVTGASGLVGKELLHQLLNKGFHVRALYHKTEIDLEDPLLEKIQGDLLDVVFLSKALENIDYVFHCAAIVSYDPADRYLLLKNNVEGTANVVNCCLESDVKKLVHVSSVAAIGRIRKQELVDETMQWSAETNNGYYGKSKYLSEMEVWRGAGEGLKTVIVNPTLILGGDDWNTGSSAIFKSVYREFPWYTEGVSGFVDVRDVARIMILLMESAIQDDRYILNGENLTYRQVFEWMAKYFGKKPPHRSVTPFIAEMVWRFEALKGKILRQKRLLTKETARTSLSKVYFDNSKILKALPDFRFTSIEETIKRTCAILLKKYQQ